MKKQNTNLAVQPTKLKQPEKKKGSGLMGRIIRRFFLVLFAVVIMAVSALVSHCKSKSCKCQSWCIRRTKRKAKEKKGINCETSIRTRKVEHYFHKKLEISGY